MAENREERVILIRVDASAAVEGSRAATSALERLERSQAAAGASLSRMEESLGRVGGYLKAQIALAAAEVGARIFEIGKQAFEAAAGLDELAEQLGTTARNLQGLQYQAVQYGVKQEQLETALSKFSQKMGEAADGSKDMVEALNALGVKNLDFQGKLRPTEVLMQEVAASIVAIEDPAKRSAAAVDMFGKAGARMLPMLAEIAKGSDASAAAAERAGAMISGDTIARLDKLADRMEANKLKHRAMMAEVLGDLAEAADGFNKWANATGASLEAWLRRQVDGLNDWSMNLSESLATGAARGAAMFLEAFRALPEQLGKLFTDAFNRALEAVESGLNKIGSGIGDSWLGRTLGIGGGSVNLGRLDGGGASFGDYSGQITAAGDAAANGQAARFAGTREAMARARQLNRMAGMEADEAAARVGKLGAVNAPGASTSGVKGAGQSEADAIAKARRDTQRDLEAQLAYAEASEKGARAVENLETHFKALKAAQDAYGKTAEANKAGVAALTAELEKMISAADRAKTLKDFNLGTESLEKSNELLEAENRLINESAEARSREIALIKLRQEVEGKGLDASNEKERAAIERREAAITQNERLKAQGEELKKSNELWLQPLKSGLESIQQTAADMWDRMLENGKFSAEEFGQLFAKTARRAAAELLALSTIRPVINLAVQGLGSLGLVSPSTASALGYGGTSSGGGGLFGGGGGSLFGGGNSLFGGSLGGWLNSPITFGGPLQTGGSPASQAVPHGATGPGLGGVTWGQGLGALAGAGMGIYNLATARGNTGKTIGGIASLVGAGVSLIPGVGQIAGPIISMLGGILPGLFGGENQEPPTMRGIGTLDWKGGAWRTTGAGYGGGQAIDLSGAGKSISSLLTGAGVDLGRLSGSYGLQQQTLSRGEFSNATVLVNGKQWGQGSNERDVGMDTAMAHIAHQMMMEVGSGISDIMREALGNYGQQNLDYAFTTQELAKAVGEIQSFESAVKSLGKEASNAEQALTAIDQQFAGLYDTAKRYGLGVGNLDAAKASQRLKVGTDFADSIARQLMDDQTGALFDIGKERTDLLRNNSALMGVAGYLDQTAKIEELYAKKRAAIIEQYNQQATAATQRAADAAKVKIQSLQDLINRLTYGDLANASPTTQYSGQRAAYMATLAQARAGSADAADRLGGVAEAYANAGRQYFGSSSEYVALIDQIKRDLIERQGAIAAGADPKGQNEALNAVLRNNQQLQQMFEASQNDNRRLVEQVAALVAQLARR